MAQLTIASIAQLAEHALRKRMVVGSIPTGGLLHPVMSYAERKPFRLHEEVFVAVSPRYHLHAAAR